MKKMLLALGVMSLLIAFVVTGCHMGDKEKHKFTEDKNDTEDVIASDLSQVKIGVCIYRFSDNYMTLFRRELESYLLDQGFAKENIVILDSADSEIVQDRHVRSFVEEGVDALIINPVDPSDVKSITNMAVEADIPLVYINREPDADEEVRWEEGKWNVTYVGCDARQSGTIQGKIIADLGIENIDRNGDGVAQYIMVEGDPDNADTQFRTEYCIKALNDAGIESDCVFKAFADWDRTEAENVVTDALQKYPDAEVIFCNNDAMALGALSAVEKAGIRAGKEIKIVGVDALTDVLIAVLEGQMAGTVFNNYVQQAHSTADAVTAYLKNENNPHYIPCDYVAVTADNAQTILENLAH
ncbi:galactose ABC transporter substrate-binding protein [Butyrivibrio sp. XB500-5]|uniref:substrate-binding domain-containing protein n=1 Tax=Butyrivibrio sp. XB500-5 TaxID=2364880 RepID=UPI000EA9F11A|nr:substrate-binding domain-containing protein [Butyrivibrio sp. XB500-5]RKM60946.1 galactose ABC transporter substrate-binding protein [Butyrivibrio sp. XB500-5]